MIIKHKLPHPLIVPAVALTAAVAAGGAIAIAPVSASAQTVSGQSQVSANWSGYTVHSSSGEGFTSVSGSWTQPAATSAARGGDGYSAFWVGIGGSSQQSQSLEQVGTSSDVVGGQAQYYAWYELVPGPETKLNLAVHPGDRMSGKVTVNGTSVTVSLSDQTTGQSVTKNLQMNNPDTSSAEWIAEAPSTANGSGSYQTLPLADFGKVTFADASATAGGHTGSISDSSWSAQPIELSSAGTSGYPGAVGSFTPAGLNVTDGSSASASPTDVSSDGSSFSVSYSSTGSTGSGSTGSDSSGTGSTGSADPGAGSGYGYGADPGAGGYGYSGDPGYPGYGTDGPGGYYYVY